MFQVEKKLIDLRTPLLTVAKMLLPLEIILHDNKFWEDKKTGLAIFLTPTSCNWYALNLNYQELGIVSNRFYLKPLLNYKENQTAGEIQSLSGTDFYPQAASCPPKSFSDQAL